VQIKFNKLTQAKSSFHQHKAVYITWGRPRVVYEACRSTNMKRNSLASHKKTPSSFSPLFWNGQWTNFLGRSKNVIAEVWRYQILPSFIQRFSFVASSVATDISLVNTVSYTLKQCSSTFLSSWNPCYTFAFVMQPPLTKITKTRSTCKKIKFFVNTSTNKQIFQKLKSKKLDDSVVLAFLECICYIQNLANRTCISNMFRPIF